MGAAHHLLAWASCIVAISLPIGIIMAIKLQEDRDTRSGGNDAGLVDGELYLRRYRFLWAVLPMALFLLVLVAMPVGVCRDDCYGSESASLMLLLSLVVGLLAWSLTISLIYNRYFHSTASRPYRFVNGTEQWMLRGSRFLATVAVVLVAAGVTQ